ncbi:methionine ABC transporter ATP-binding protein [Staphylococcus lugdunensis]|uniref:methionine ABC transporter ATP-binding protein n=1 Tax=Staphylococcus lugdunensis TaxID=28035 RepID=UPI002094CD91|nr:methionine ABC transporter ATP-binding protein [Staphylococcus lugdunensis]
MGVSPIQALKDVSFKIEKHDIFGVIGYSGAGKSTLVRLVNQLEQVSDGEVIVDGKDINTYSEKDLRNVKKDIGMIFQHFNLLNSATVFKNVAMPLILSHKHKDEIKAKVEEMLEFVGLADKMHQFPDELSGGQKQRVAIARALVTNPKILLCDEATSALDPATTSSILKLLSNVNQTFGVTIMLITHEMSVIQKICNRVAVMEQGEVIELGTVKEVFSHPQTETTKNFVSTVINTEPSTQLQALFKLVNDTSHVVYSLFLDAQQVTSPLINTLIRNYGVDVNIIYSSMSAIQENTVCYLWLDIQLNDVDRTRIENYFSQQHIEYEEVV